MPAFFAKTNEPVRIFYDIPDHTTDKGVRALVFEEGSTVKHEDDSDILIATLTLTHRTEGRYSVLYSPPDNRGDRLTIKFVVYTDTGFGTKASTYWAGSQQIILNSGVGQLGGSAIVRDEQLSKIADITAEKVWQMKLDSVTEDNTAGVWLKTRASDDDVAGSAKFVIDRLDKINIGSKNLASGLSAILNGLESNIKNEIKKRASKDNSNNSNKSSELSLSLSEIKEAIKTLKNDKTSINGIKDLIKQQKAVKGDILAINKSIKGDVKQKKQKDSILSFKNNELNMRLSGIDRIVENLKMQEGLTQSTLINLGKNNNKNKKEIIDLIKKWQHQVNTVR